MRNVIVGFVLGVVAAVVAVVVAAQFVAAELERQPAWGYEVRDE